MGRHLARVRRIFREDPFTAVEAVLLAVMLAGVGAASVVEQFGPPAADGFAGRILLVTVGGGLACTVLALIGHAVYDVWRVVRADLRPVPETGASRLRFVWRILETVALVLWMLWVALSLWTLPDLPDNEQAGGFVFAFLFVALGGLVLLVFLAAVRIVATAIYRTWLRDSERSRTDPDERSPVDDSTGGEVEDHATAGRQTTTVGQMETRDTAGEGTGPPSEETILPDVFGDSYSVAKRRLLAGMVGAMALGTVLVTARAVSPLAPLALLAPLPFLAGSLCALGLLVAAVGHARSDLGRSGTEDGASGGTLAVVARLGRGTFESVGALVLVVSTRMQGGSAGHLTPEEAVWGFGVAVVVPLLLLGVVWGIGAVVYRGLRALAGVI